MPQRLTWLTWRASTHDQRLFAQAQRHLKIKSVLSPLGQLDTGVRLRWSSTARGRAHGLLRRKASSAQPARRAARSQSVSRRVAAPAQRQAVEPGARGAVGERANGPVVGYLANQSAIGTKTDTPILTTPQSI